MKMCVAICGMLAFVAIGKAETGFLKTLPAEDYSSAGLSKLSPDELARLESLVQRYKSGEVAQAREQVEAKATASQEESQRKIEAAEKKAKDAQARADEVAQRIKTGEASKSVSGAKKQPGWFTALITLNHASQKPEKEEPLESRLAGDFRGWNSNTVFKLEDGTQWILQNKSEAYIYSPTLHGPKVKISPAAIRGFWLEIDGVNLRVRVVPSQLPDAPSSKEP